MDEVVNGRVSQDVRAGTDHSTRLPERSGTPPSLERFERLSRIYRTLSDTNEAIICATSEPEMCQRVCEITAALGGLRLVWIAMRDPARGVLVPVASAGGAGGPIMRLEIPLDRSLPYGDSPSADAFRSGKVQVLQDYLADPDKVHMHALAQVLGARSTCHLPIHRRGEIAGVFCMGSAAPGYFDADVVDLLEGMVRDLSFGLDHIARAAELRASEERYRTLVENLDDVVLQLDAEGRFAFVSSSIERFHYRAEELLGRPFARVIPSEEMETAMRLWGESQLLGHRSVVEMRVLDGHDRVRSVRAASRPFIEAGRIMGLQVVITDLTLQRDVEERLRAAQKMEAIGQLAGGIAHDFNNLLMVISSYTELAIDALPEGEPAREDLDEVCKAATRAAGLTRQLLAFSRKQVLRPQILDLNELVGGMEKMLARMLGEDVDLAFAPGESLGPTRADAGQIEQVLMNLAVNARDAMPNGGTLRVQTSNIDVDDERANLVLGLHTGPYVVISVTDTGTGMNDATKAHIFEPFFTTKPQGKGTGLGLATVFGIVQQSGGALRVESELGKGSTFEIYLPRAIVTTPPPGTLSQSAKRQHGTETILLVEDEQAVRAVAERLLGAAGYKVIPAATGAEALRLGAQHAADVDLLITDVVMPGMNGRDLATRMEAERPDLRVLYISGYTDDAIVLRGVQSQDAAFLGKPFSADALLRKVREVLDAPTGAAELS